MPLEIIIIVVIAVAVLAGTLMGMYNSMITVRNDVQKAFENIDVVLQQRHDELRKLIDTTKAYMRHETGLLNQLTELRTGYAAATNIDDKVRSENDMRRVEGQLSAVWEGYPDLKASQNFLQVQNQVSALESKLADYREKFNDSVNTYNIQIERFPDLFMARAMRMQRHLFLEVPKEKKQDVVMDFSG